MVEDFSDVRCRFKIFPNKDVLEDVPKKKRYGLKDAKLVMARLRPIVSALKSTKKISQTIFFFKYPKFSVFCMFVLLLITYFFEGESILTYLLFTGITFLAYFSP